METNALRPLRAVLSKFKKLWVIIMIIVMLIVSIGIFIFKDFSLGYKYYEFNNETNTQVTVGYGKEEINIFSVIEEYLKQLENDGYYTVSYTINTEIFSKKTVIPKKEINTDEIKQKIIDGLEVSIFSKKVIIKEDVYYFKNEDDKSRFVKELNSIKKVDYNEKEEIIKISQLTKQETLNKKIETIKKEKQKEDAAKKAAEENKKQQALQTARKNSTTTRGTVSSRGSDTIRSSTTKKSTYKGGAPMASYVYISSPYGMRHGKMHTGTDFAAPKGTHVYAWKSGTVIQASWSGGYGNFIAIQHNDGTVSRYAHLSGYNCKKGDKVTKGQTIGYVGSTGNSTGAHLHFEIKINGKFVNPVNYL